MRLGQRRLRLSEFLNNLQIIILSLASKILMFCEWNKILIELIINMNASFFSS